ncbi:aldo/keto reductase [Desulfoluna butyratoxydans]|uniref:Nadp-dependent oxidoreductase domain n=1 Tax=Desulfoluna butyratoxydans TaxID=231438 RepID=A0A4U8YW40_9BACT|nr:aldo/keto reductase [Desulfoluna butyratoxydans]VFQ46212.1 nadp-dependent oxidoreductase domain [Desulfoluna butyratoxydans]
MIKQVPLGKTSIRVSRMGLGCMGMSEFYGPSDDANSLTVLERALELGITFYDTADMYGHGHNEKLIGRFIKGKRNRIVLATKFGIIRKEKGIYERTIDNSPAYLRKACEASLKRLGVDHIDLYYAHRLNPEQDLDAMMGELSRLVEEGKIRAVGLSEVSAEQLRRAHAIHPVAAVQSEYSLWTRDIEENGLLAACRELGVGFVPYSPLGRGFLTGTITDTKEMDSTDFRRMSPRFEGKNLDRNLVLVASVQELAKEKQCTPAQVALAWVMAQGEDIVPIPGTRRTRYLEDNAGALQVTLEASDLTFLDDVFTSDAVAGERYPQEGMKGLSA